MTGMFPNGGAPAATVENSLLDVATAAGCPPLWYNTNRCNTRFDAAAQNALMSELFSIMKAGSHIYDCTTFTNLLEAIKTVIGIFITDCLPESVEFDPAGDACSIKYLAIATGADGCKKLVSFNPENVIGTWTNASVWGGAFSAYFPAAPTDGGVSFYTLAALQADAAANTINESKLFGNWLVSATFTLPCTTDIEFDITQVVRFDPTANGGNGRDSYIVARRDGVFHSANNNITPTLAITNFQRMFNGKLRMTLPAGAHTINFYIVSGVLQPAQVEVIGSTSLSGTTITARRSAI